MKTRFSVLLSFFRVCAGFNLATLAMDAEEKTLLVVGDSLSAGFGLDLADTWVALLESKLRQEGYGYKVVNASISGDTTGNGMRRFDRAMNIHQPDIVIIELGGNDGLRGYPVDLMQQNLDTMIRAAHDSESMVVLAGIQIPPNYGEQYAGEFAAVYPTLAEKHDVLLIPFFLKNVALNPGMMQADGIHPNKQAQPHLMDNVWQTLGPALASKYAN
jgi:acyl-CoA thioesterase-1